MVSRLLFLAVSFGVAMGIPAANGQSATQPAQATPQPTSQQSRPLDGLMAESRTGQPPAVQPKPANLVTPEMRGDIFMAEKKYGEAVEAYKEGPHDSAILLN